MFYSLGQFATAVGATTKWVLNAHAVLHLSPEYTADRALTFTIARALEDGWDIPLTSAFELAGRLLNSQPSAGVWRMDSEGKCTSLVVDRDRLLSAFAVRLSLATEGYAERRRGRRREPLKDALKEARRHGVDISLLRASLERTPEKRLKTLDDDVRFVSNLTVVRK